MALELVKSVQAVAARIALWSEAARAETATAVMMGATSVATIAAVVVGLVLGMRRAVVKMEVRIASWI